MSMIDLKDQSFTYDGSYDPVFEQIRFQLDTDRKLGSTGHNGRGMTRPLRKRSPQR